MLTQQFVNKLKIENVTKNKDLTFYFLLKQKNRIEAFKKLRALTFKMSFI